MTLKKLKKLLESEEIGLVIVGPEQPLVYGLVDYLKANNKSLGQIRKQQH